LFQIGFVLEGVELLSSTPYSTSAPMAFEFIWFDPSVIYFEFSEMYLRINLALTYRLQ